MLRSSLIPASVSLIFSYFTRFTMPIKYAATSRIARSRISNTNNTIFLLFFFFLLFFLLLLSAIFLILLPIVYIQPCVCITDAVLFRHGSIFLQVEIGQPHLRVPTLMTFDIFSSGNHTEPSTLRTNVYFHHNCLPIIQSALTLLLLILPASDLHHPGYLP